MENQKTEEREEKMLRRRKKPMVQMLLRLRKSRTES